MQVSKCNSLPETIFQLEGSLTTKVKVSVVLPLGISRIFCEAQVFPVSYSNGVRNHAHSLLNGINN